VHNNMDTRTFYNVNSSFDGNNNNMRNTSCSRNEKSFSCNNNNNKSSANNRTNNIDNNNSMQLPYNNGRVHNNDYNNYRMRKIRRLRF